MKKTVEEHQKSLKLKKDDTVSRELSKDIMLEAVKQSLSEETFQILLKMTRDLNYLSDRLFKTNMTTHREDYI